MRRWWLIASSRSSDGAPAIAQEEEEEADPAQVAIGERLFLETRFAQFAAAQGRRERAVPHRGSGVQQLATTPGASRARSRARR
jgi:hypothetical protein